MFKSEPIRQIHLADQQFAHQIVGKYGWRIDNGFARSKLEHRGQPKKRDAMTFAKSPIIQLTKVIQPLHIKLIYEYHQLNQIIQYKNAPLLASSPLSDVTIGVTVDGASNAASQHTVTLLEKVKQAAQLKAERQLLQQVQSQIERKTILTTSHQMQGHEAIIATNSQQLNNTQVQAIAKLVRTPLTTTNQASERAPLANVNQASDRTSATALSSVGNVSLSILSNRQTVDGLHHIDQSETTQRISEKQVAVAKMMLSPYIRNIVREEQERITAELVERNTRYRKKATLYETQALTDAEVHSVARKAVINKSLSTVLEQWHRKLTIEQVTMLRQQKQQGVQFIRSKSQHEILHTNSEQRNNALREPNYEQRQSNINRQSNPERQTIINDMKYYLKTTAQHINTIKYHQRTLQGEQKLVYIPFVNRDATTVNENAKLIYRNPLTKVDSRITNNQHSYKQEINNSKHSRQQAESSNAAKLATRQLAIITGEASKKQQRRIESTAVQIRSILSFHQQLIERNERLIYQIEMVEKKKTPRARKLSLVPVVKLSYRALPEEQRRDFVRVPQAQLAVDKEPQVEISSPILSKKAGIRRQAELIYTVNRKYLPGKDQQTTRQITQEVSQKASQEASQQVTKQVSQQITQQVSQEASQQAKQQVTTQMSQHKQTNLLSARAITLTNEERIKQRVSSARATNLSNELITERPGHTKMSVTGQLTHISKVNKTQLQQVKVLQSKMRQLQAVTLLVPQTSRIGTANTNSGATNYSTGQSEQSSSNRKDTMKTTMLSGSNRNDATRNSSQTSSNHNASLRTKIEHPAGGARATGNDGSASVIPTNYNVNHSQSKPLFYRVSGDNHTQQLGALITQLQQTSSRPIQGATNNAVVVDTAIIYKPISMTSIAMNSMTTKRINLIHSSQQQGEQLTKRLKQLGEVTTLHKVKHIISTHSPLSTVQIKTTDEQNLQLIVNEQSGRSRSQMVEQGRHHTQSSMNLHIAKQQSMQQDDTKQQEAVKQLEVTVKRLEQELSTAKEAKAQPNVNIRQLSDQLFDQITKKIRLEQQRNGR